MNTNEQDLPQIPSPLVVPREGRSYGQIMKFIHENHPSATTILFHAGFFEIHFSNEIIPALKVHSLQESEARGLQIAKDYFAAINHASMEEETNKALSSRKHAATTNRKRTVARRLIFTPGNVLKSQAWGYDLVLEYEELEDYRWYVTVVHVKMGSMGIGCGAN